MTVAPAPAPTRARAAERPRPALLFRHEDLFREPAYTDGQPYGTGQDEDETNAGIPVHA